MVCNLDESSRTTILLLDYYYYYDIAQKVLYTDGASGSLKIKRRIIIIIIC